MGCGTRHYLKLLKIDPDYSLYKLKHLHSGWHYNLWGNYSARGTGVEEIEMMVCL